MAFQDSKTYANLLAAYDWERSVNSEYQINSDKARREGYIEISNIFNTIASQEKAHAVIWLRLINEGTTPTTEQNLANAVKIESFSGNEMYRDYARVASEEGYNDIAALFNGVANIELLHDVEFNNKYVDITNNQVFCKPAEVLWVCINCGNVMSALCAPEICPVCGFPQGYYEVFNSTNM